MNAKLKYNKKQWVMSGLTPTVYACRELGVDYISISIIGSVNKPVIMPVVLDDFFHDPICMNKCSTYHT